MSWPVISGARRRMRAPAASRSLSSRYFRVAAAQRSVAKSWADIPPLLPTTVLVTASRNPLCATPAEAKDHTKFTKADMGKAPVLVAAHSATATKNPASCWGWRRALKDHTMLESSWGLNWSSWGMAAAAMAVKRSSAVWWTVAKAQATLARSWVLKACNDFKQLTLSWSMSTGSWIPSVAQAHAVFANPCGWNSATRPAATVRSWATSLWWLSGAIFSVASAQKALDTPWTLKSGRRAVAMVRRVSISGRASRGALSRRDRLQCLATRWRAVARLTSLKVWPISPTSARISSALSQAQILWLFCTADRSTRRSAGGPRRTWACRGDTACLISGGGACFTTLFFELLQCKAAAHATHSASSGTNEADSSVWT
mmetsp:Transcript_12903/g.31010  ORF Transcript_12903/g.31010 Transcript_12903/m.31010 type:complete len:372 (-) Transcript_12903:254-1369(-)